MVIFADTTTVGKQRSGTSTYILHLLDGLCRSRHASSIMAYGGSPSILQPIEKYTGDRINYVPASSSSHSLNTTFAADFPSASPYASASDDPFASKSPLASGSPYGSTSPHIALNYELAGNHNRQPADISFFPNYFMAPGWPAPSAVTIHDVSFLSHPGFYSFKMRQWYRKRIQHTITRADVILTVSQASRTAIMNYLDVDPGHIMVLPPCWYDPMPDNRNNPPGKPSNCFDRQDDPGSADTSPLGKLPHDCFTVDSPPHGKPYFLYVGSIEPKKNLLALLEAYHTAGLADIDLIVIGRPNASTQYYRTFQEKVKRTPGVYYLGYRDDPTVNTYLAHCHGLVLISHIEGFGIPLFQALSKGIPALISDDPALCELAGGHALITNTEDPGVIAEHLRQLQETGGKRNPATGSWCRMSYSRDNYDKQLDAIIERLSQRSTPVVPVLTVKNQSVRRAIIEGICYAAVFDAPLNAEKLYTGLRHTRASRQTFHATLEKLLTDYPRLFKTENSLIRLAPVSRHLPHHQSEAVRRKHRRVLQIIAMFPWIRAIYFSGGTVHGTGLETMRDLDIFVVTRQNRVWLSYLLIRLAGILTGKRHSLCCNYLVDESAMLITWQQEFYTAFQLLHLKQAVRKPGTPHMRTVNSWVYHMFPNAPRYDPSPLPYTGDKRILSDQNPLQRNPIRWHSSTRNPFRRRSTRRGILYHLNLLVMVLFEYKWMKIKQVNRSGGVRFDVHRIKLHTNDHRPAVYSHFQKIFNKVQKIIRSSKKNATLSVEIHPTRRNIPSPGRDISLPGRIHPVLSKETRPFS